MILKAFALMDAKVAAFSAPFYAQHPGHAIRMCMEAAMDRNSTIGKYPADFILYEVGSFDDATGELKSASPFVNLGPVLGFLPAQPMEEPNLFTTRGSPTPAIAHSTGNLLNGSAEQ